MTSTPRRILIVLHGSIGDVVRAIPLAAALRHGFPAAKLAWAVEPPSAGLLQGLAELDEIIVFDRPHWWRGIWPFLAAVRAGRFDVVVDLQRHLKSGLISLFSGARIRVGFNRADCKEFNWLFNNRYIEAAAEDYPKIHQYMRFAESLGIPAQPIRWQFNFQAEEEKQIDDLLSGVSRGYGVLFVGTRWPSKQWFPRQMADTARFLSGRYNLDVVLLGGGEDQRMAAELNEVDGVSIKNLVGQTSLRQAAGIIARARVAIGPDTGLMHIAAAVGTPVVSLWGATNPARTGPFGFDDLVIQGRAPCAPCYRKRCSVGRVCMQSIGAGEIHLKIAAALDAVQ